MRVHHDMCTLVFAISKAWIMSVGTWLWFWTPSEPLKVSTSIFVAKRSPAARFERASLPVARAGVRGNLDNWRFVLAMQQAPLDEGGGLKV